MPAYKDTRIIGGVFDEKIRTLAVMGFSKELHST
jgi:hypothetical protein